MLQEVVNFILFVCFQLGRFTEALDHCNKALHCNPKEIIKVKILRKRGRIQCSLGNCTAAIQDSGDVYEIVSTGNTYDGKLKLSKYIMKIDF